MTRYINDILHFGIRSDDNFLTRNRTIVLNGTSFFVLLIEILLGAINFSHGKYINLTVNVIAAFFICLPTLLLNKFEKQKLSLTVFSAGHILNTTFIGVVLLRKGEVSGMENLFLTFCIFAVLMFDGAAKVSLVVMSAVLYMAFRIALPYYTTIPFNITMITTSILTFGTMYGVTEVFRRSFLESQAIILRQNKQLSQQTQALKDANLLRENLFAMMSHDLRSPLISLNEYLRTALKPTLQPNECKAVIRNVAMNVENLSLMTNNLLLWSIGQSKGFRTLPVQIPLADILEEALEMANLMITNKNLIIASTKTPVTISADETHLLLIFDNLLHNAIKFAPCGSTIFIDIADSPAQTVCSFRNTVQEDNNEKASTGTGLGLVVVSDLMRNNGGLLEYGQYGNTFESRLIWDKK